MSTTNLLTTPDERWLTCRIDAGMFSDERAVTYPADGETQKSVFVRSTQVKGEPGQQGHVRVRIIRRNGLLLAVLPSSNQDIVTVREADVSPT